MPPPTEKQLTYLNSLGYVGTAPTSVEEASQLISSLKDGLGSPAAEKGMLFERASPIDKARLYISDVEERKRNGNEIAGWRLKVPPGGETSQNSIYNGAFLPFSVARQFPELLAISGLNFDSELQRRPAKGPIVVAPNELSEITPATRERAVSPQRPVPPPIKAKSGGCMGVLMTVALLMSSILFVWWR